MTYFQYTKDFMLVYSNSDDLEIVGYVDSDFNDMKSTSGYVRNDWWGYFIKVLARLELFLSPCSRVYNVLWCHYSGCMVTEFVLGLKTTCYFIHADFVSNLSNPVKSYNDSYIFLYIKKRFSGSKQIELKIYENKIKKGRWSLSISV